MSGFLVTLAAIAFIPVVYSSSPRNCSLIQCFPPVCKAGEILGPIPKGSCCPGCIPDPPASVRCALPVCLVGFTARVPSGQSCPVCLPDCSTVRCLKPVCKPGQRAEVPEDQCCPVCVPDCAAVSCLRPTCKPGENLEVPEGECCPVCMPDCSAVSCLRPTCKPGEKLEVPSGECCPVCVRQCEIEGQVFSTCASPCHGTCENPNPVCIGLCVEGCKCPPGQVIDSKSKRCVLPRSCPSKGLSLLK